MRPLSIFLLFAGGTLAVLGPLGLVLLAVDGRQRRNARSTRFCAKAALWSGFVVYSALATAAFFAAKNAPAALSPWEFVRSGLVLMNPVGLAALMANGFVCLWAWWILRDEERHPDRALVAAALAEERAEKERRKAIRAATAWTPPVDGK